MFGVILMVMFLCLLSIYNVFILVSYDFQIEFPFAQNSVSG